MTAFYKKAKFAEELSIDATTFTGSYQALGSPISIAPAIIIIQNDATQDVILSDDGTTDGLTIPTGVRLVLDLRANHAKDWEFTFPVNTQFYVSASAGTGDFRMSLIYGLS